MYDFFNSNDLTSTSTHWVLAYLISFYMNSSVSQRPKLFIRYHCHPVSNIQWNCLLERIHVIDNWNLGGLWSNRIVKLIYVMSQIHNRDWTEYVLYCWQTDWILISTIARVFKQIHIFNIHFHFKFVLHLRKHIIFSMGYSAESTPQASKRLFVTLDKFF